VKIKKKNQQHAHDAVFIEIHTRLQHRIKEVTIHPLSLILLLE
jgi:hypothetical protein